MRRLTDHGVGKPRSARKKDDRAQSKIALYAEFLKNKHVQTDQAEEQNDSKNSVRVKIEVAIGEGLQPLLLQDLHAPKASADTQDHVQVQEEIAPKQFAADRAHHY